MERMRDSAASFPPPPLGIQVEHGGGERRLEIMTKRVFAAGGALPVYLPIPKFVSDGAFGMEGGVSSGASVVAIDNKIEQAMDLVKSHLMYAVREEVEVLKEQIKELIEKNNQLEQENNLLKTLASPEQLAQFQAQLQTSPSPAPSQPQGTTPQPSQPTSQGSGPSA
uniref:TSC22 domain family protein 1 isoform X5 n=1 Tax=Podarcis muralis TaxID=64176 RepID=UPI0010A04883|nr:TSC22 domain family protein 1 isoform X5 [Podarcis muralis]